MNELIEITVIFKDTSKSVIRTPLYPKIVDIEGTKWLYILSNEFEYHFNVDTIAGYTRFRYPVTSPVKEETE